MRKNNRNKQQRSSRSALDMPLLLNKESSSGYVPPIGNDHHLTIVRDIQQSSQLPSLYDSSAMLELSSSLCEGYITLLSAGKLSEQACTGEVNESTYSNIELAYAAIVDGNVIDACFGVHFSSKKNTSMEKHIKDAKEMIVMLVNSNPDENLEEVVVKTYCSAFQSIVRMNAKMKQLNIFTKCLCTKRLWNQTSQALLKCFHPLQQEIMKHQSTQQHV